MFPIYTLGYGIRTIEQVLGLLREYQINCVVDVRSYPYSQFQPDFSRDRLEKTLKQNSIRYEHMGSSLGGRPTDVSCITDGKVDYEKYRQKAYYQQGIAQLQAAWKQDLHIVILCSEGKPEECHRSKLIGRSLSDLNVDVVHIDERGLPRTHDEVTCRLTGGQLALFPEYRPHFTSRKKYHKEGTLHEEVVE